MVLLYIYYILVITSSTEFKLLFLKSYSDYKLLPRVRTQRYLASIYIYITYVGCIHTSEQCCCIQQCLSKFAFRSWSYSTRRDQTFIIVPDVDPRLFPKERSKIALRCY
jgi:hypothetical protein